MKLGEVEKSQQKTFHEQMLDNVMSSDNVVRLSLSDEIMICQMQTILLLQ